MLGTGSTSGSGRQRGERCAGSRDLTDPPGPFGKWPRPGRRGGRRRSWPSSPPPAVLLQTPAAGTLAVIRARQAPIRPTRRRNLVRDPPPRCARERASGRAVSPKVPRAGVWRSRASPTSWVAGLARALVQAAVIAADGAGGEATLEVEVEERGAAVRVAEQPVAARGASAEAPHGGGASSHRTLECARKHSLSFWSRSPGVLGHGPRSWFLPGHAVGCVRAGWLGRCVGRGSDLL